MRRTARALFTLVVAGLVAAAVAAMPAATATKIITPGYTLAGIETSASTNAGTFAGTLVGRIGLWQATIYHAELNKDPNTDSGQTAITGGTFTIKALGSPRIEGTDVTGTLTAQAPVGRFFCSQQFDADGYVSTSVGTGTLGGTLTHYGTMSGGVCNAVFATISATITIP